MEMLQLLKNIIFQYKKWKPDIATKNILYHFLTRERRKQLGNAHSDKTFYVIRSIDDKSPFYIGPVHHLLANYFYVISHLWYAHEKGWIPVIDQENYPVYNTLPNPVHGTTNAWEYFWEQPSSYTLKDVYNSKNVILSQRSWFWQHDLGYDEEKYKQPSEISAYHVLMDSVPLNHSTAAFVEEMYQKYFPQMQRVLGVSVRYVGYSRRSYCQGDGHPVAPELDTIVQAVAKRFSDWNMERIFLSCDDTDAAETFREAFGDKLVCLPRQRTDATKVYDQKNINPLYWPENIYNTSLLYLTETELLSRCTALIGSITSGFRYAVVRNNNAYEHVEMLEQGLFPDRRKRNR